MDITEKAKMYAEGKALEAITSAIEKAYAEGYKDGYKDGIAKTGIEPLVEIVDGITYIDLGLPSGKKWSFEYLLKKATRLRDYARFTYEEASKYNIPTKEDYLELFNFCELIPKKSPDNKIYQWDFLDKKNGNYIHVSKTYAEIASTTKEYESFVFWLRDNNPEGEERLCADGSRQDLLGKNCMGYKLPIMLVK